MDNITTSTEWINGFVKEAAEQGLELEVIHALCKVATHMYSEHADDYINGFNEELKQAFAPQGSTMFGAIRDTVNADPFARMTTRNSGTYFKDQLADIGSNTTLSDEDRYGMLSQLMRNRKNTLQSQLADMRM